VLRTPDVLVVGGGVIGCAVADTLAATGRTVLLVDRGAIGGEASSAAAGVLAVAGGDAEGAELRLRRASLECHPALAATLLADTGIDVELDRSGTLELFDAGDEARATERLAHRRAQGFRVDWLDARTLRAEEPAAAPSACGALLFHDDAWLVNERLVEGLAASARRRGAELVPGAAVRAAERAGSRISRVQVGADWVAPGTVVLAAGAWSARVPDVAPELDVRPARGQMLALRPNRPLCRRVLAHGDSYLVPRRSGEVLVGATVEDAGWEKAVTPAGLRVLLGHVERIAPAGLAAPVSRVWAGLRPYAPAGGPIIGRAPTTENLVLACGHHRNGILLAPITAAIVQAVLDGTAAPVDVDPFAPR
jgi:glycine oxidase